METTRCIASALGLLSGGTVFILRINLKDMPRCIETVLGHGQGVRKWSRKRRYFAHFLHNARDVTCYANLHIGLRFPTIAEFKNQVSKKYFDSALLRTTLIPLVLAVSSYVPLREHSRVRKIHRTKGILIELDDPVTHTTLKANQIATLSKSLRIDHPRRRRRKTSQFSAYSHRLSPTTRPSGGSLQQRP